MKKAAIILLVMLIAFAIVGCNVAPNVPGVTITPTTTVTPTPYTTNDTYRYGYNGYDYYTASPNALSESPNLNSTTDESIVPES